MIVEVKVPSPGESISEVEIAKWLVENGEQVEKDQEIAEIDSDKATLTVNAEESGKIEIIAKEGDSIKVGAAIARIDTEAKGRIKKNEAPLKDSEPVQKGNQGERVKLEDQSKKEAQTFTKDTTGRVVITPQAQKLIEEESLHTDAFLETIRGKRVTKRDVMMALAAGAHGKTKNFSAKERSVEKAKLSTLRRKLADRLVAVKNETAMLTTFNEVDMSEILSLRKKHGKKFHEKHGVKLGFVSFFLKAASNALLKYPEVNGQIAEDHIKYFNFVDIGVAVSTKKGLMVPVVRDVHKKNIATIEQEIYSLAENARAGKISLQELEGGTFSVSNGGVFGSLLSTPILNPPQSAILGMHTIQDRPVAINGKVIIRPMMYLALSYDHRIIDGKESVGFLKTIISDLENPVKMLFHQADAEQELLSL